MWQNVTECDRMWQNVTECDRMWQNVTECDRMWQNVTECDRMWQNVTECDRMWQNVTECDRMTAMNLFCRRVVVCAWNCLDLVSVGTCEDSACRTAWISFQKSEFSWRKRLGKLCGNVQMFAKSYCTRLMFLVLVLYCTNIVNLRLPSESRTRMSMLAVRSNFHAALTGNARSPHTSNRMIQRRLAAHMDTVALELRQESWSHCFAAAGLFSCLAWWKATELQRA